jgi:hypothetical protein
MRQFISTTSIAFVMAGSLSLLALGCGDDSGTTCPQGTATCSGICVETDVDPNNCGGCGDVCDTGETCSSGQCELVCSGGTTDCGGDCVDTNIDPANCGGCGDVPNAGDNICTVGEVCTAGVCALHCTNGTTDCDGSCVDTQTDEANCGGCGDDPNVGDNVCVGAEECVAGVCEMTCTAGETGCGGVCVNTLHDENNCGGCGDVPNAGDHICTGPNICVAGVCAPNDPPVATFPTGSATFIGHPYIDATVTAVYIYSDADNDPEGTSLYQWNRCLTGGATPIGCSAINGATNPSYTVQQADVGQYLALEVTPVATQGANPGTTVLSEAYGPILDWHLSHEDTDEYRSVKVVSALDGSIYVAYLAASNAPPTVFHYDGTTKTVLGATLPGSYGSRLDLALNPVTGYPILIYVDNADTKLLRIREWDGTAWTNMDYDVDAMVTWFLGNIAVACDHTGAAVISYVSDTGGPSPTYIARWSGSAWTPLGPAFVTEGAMGLAVGPDNLPVYMKWGWPGHTVYRWDDTAWGALGATFDSAQYNSAIQVDSNSTPTLWLRPGNPSVIEVRQWIAGAWQMLGSGMPGVLGAVSNMEVSDVPTFSSSDNPPRTFTMYSWNAGTTTWSSLGVFHIGAIASPSFSHDIAAVLSGHHYAVLSNGLILYK